MARYGSVFSPEYPPRCSGAFRRRVSAPIWQHVQSQSIRPDVAVRSGLAILTDNSPAKQKCGTRRSYVPMPQRVNDSRMPTVRPTGSLSPTAAPWPLERYRFLALLLVLARRSLQSFQQS
jgi:hypothetical protein